MKNKFAVMLVVFVIAAFAVTGCVTAQKKAESGFQDPMISLEMMEVPQYDGYWYFAASVKPTKGDAGDRGAPLPMSFLFNIHNPNPYPVLLEGIQFTVALDGEFDVVTVNAQDENWIPAGKTDQVRATTMVTARSVLLSLMVTAGFKLKEKGWSPWDALERWWKGVPEYSVPVTVKEGAFSFVCDGQAKVLPFEATFP
jgi:hypothetical protein